MNRLLLCLTFTLGANLMPAAVLTNVPMQGSMLMPKVYYHADTDSVTVDLTSILVTAQLTPLLISHPNDRFDPADPWFDSLDPSRQGLAFSRRYGFDPDVMSDLLPDDRQLWIRKLFSSPELGLYDYSATPEKWKPVLGTAGTSNAVYWNGEMWHFGVTAPPGTNLYTATFEIFVMNTSTGQEVSGSSSGPFVLDWTDVPDSRPELKLTTIGGDHLVVTWPATATNWLLLSTTNLDAADWITNTTPVTINHNQATVVISNVTPRQFFRLQHLP